ELFELIELAADAARILWMAHQQKKHVMKKDVGHEQRNNGGRGCQQKMQNNVQRCSLTAATLLKIEGGLTWTRAVPGSTVHYYLYDFMLGFYVGCGGAQWPQSFSSPARRGSSSPAPACDRVLRVAARLRPAVRDAGWRSRYS